MNQFIRSQRLVNEEQAIWKQINLLIKNCRIKSAQINANKLAIDIFYDKANYFKQRNFIPIVTQSKFENEMTKLRPRIIKFRDQNQKEVAHIAKNFLIDEKQQLKALIDQVQQRNFSLIRDFFSIDLQEDFLKCIWPNQIWKAKMRKIEENQEEQSKNSGQLPRVNSIEDDQESNKIFGLVLTPKKPIKREQEYQNPTRTQPLKPIVMNQILAEAYSKILNDFGVPKDQFQEYLERLKKDQFNQVADDAVVPVQKLNFLNALLEARNSCKKLQKQNNLKQMNRTLDEAYSKILYDFGVPIDQFQEYLERLKKDQFNQVADDAVVPVQKLNFLNALLKARNSCKKPSKQNNFKQELEQLLKKFIETKEHIECSIKYIIQEQNQKLVAQSYVRGRKLQQFYQQVKKLRSKYAEKKFQGPVFKSMKPQEFFNQILAFLLTIKGINHSIIFEVVDAMFDLSAENEIESIFKFSDIFIQRIRSWKNQILPTPEVLEIKLSQSVNLAENEKRMLYQIIEIRLKILKQIAIKNLKNSIANILHQERLEQYTDILNKINHLNQEKKTNPPRVRLRTLEQQVSNYQKIAQKIKQYQNSLAKYEEQFQNMDNFCIQSMQIENRQRIINRQTFLMFINTLKQDIIKWIKRNQFGEYFKDKRSLLNLFLWELYKQNNQTKIIKFCRKFIFNGEAKIIFLQTKKSLFELLRAKFMIPSQDIVLLAIKDCKECSVFDLQRCEVEAFLNQSQDCMIEIKKGQKMPLKINNVAQRVIISKQFSTKIVKQICKIKLQQNQISLNDNSFKVNGISLDNQQYELKDTISNTQLLNNITIKALEIIFDVAITVYFDTDYKQHTLSSKDTIYQLKEKMYKDLDIPIKLQIIFGIIGGNDKQQQLENERSIGSLINKKNSLQVTLISKVSLLHFGFNQRVKITNQQFICFFVEKSEQKKKMIQKFKFRNIEQNDTQINFFRNLVPYLFSVLKKLFKFQVVTQDFQQGISTSMGKDIWIQETGQNSTFNSNFISVYLLSNSDNKLRINLMNLMKKLYPIPMYFRQYQNINKLKDQWTLNEQLVWIIHPSINICSIGLHNQRKQQKGKSCFLNKLFFTQFTQRHFKHPIAQGSPEIALNIYGKYFELNLIDIPRQCPRQIQENVLEKSNILIIHSWKTQQQTNQQINKLQRKFPRIFVICFIRDHSIGLTKINKNIKDELSSGMIIPVSNLQKVNQKHSIFSQLREKMNQIIKNISKDPKLQTKKLFQLYQDRTFTQFQYQLEKMEKTMHQLRVVGTFHEKFNELNRNNYTEEVKRDIQKLKQSKDLKIHPILNQILRFISENAQKADILFQRFKQVIRKYKEKAQRPYYVLYQCKQQLEGLNQNDPYFNQKIRSIDERLNLIKHIKIDLIGKTKQKALNLVVQKGIWLESQIRPLIFSIQLAWRQLVYLSIHKPETMIGDLSIEKFLVQSKKRQARLAQPFEVIDGDSLEMPKQILKKMFEAQDKKIAVASIIGPQSSGKSTLLNFLFGCDFAVSQGRCTRGVYGSYFDLSNMKNAGLDGILILDTEGLFAILNKKDEKNRQDFDSKLVLFCLTVSDIVIINTKGNIDSETCHKLKSAMNKFYVFVQQNVAMPKIFLVFNQGNSASTQSSLTDINKMSQIFSLKNSCSLAQAYDIKQIGNNQISLLNVNQKIVKKEAKKQFQQQVSILRDNILNQIEKKGSFKCAAQIIDHMQTVWATIERFPNLANSSSKRLKELENEIAQWKSKRLHEDLNECVKKATRDYQAKKLNRLECQQAVKSICTEILQDFAQKLINGKQRNEHQNHKVRLEQNIVQLYIDASRRQMQQNMNSIQAMHNVRLAKQQGDFDINQAIRTVKISQNREKRQMSEREKIQIFQKAFQYSIQRTQRVINAQNQLIKTFVTIKYFYQNALLSSSSSKRETGLPKLACTLNYSDGDQKIIKEIQKNMQSLIIYSGKPHTNVLKGGRTNALCKYFDMTGYFKKNQQKNYFVIMVSDILLHLDKLKLQNSIQSRIKQKQIDQNLLNDIFQNINHQLQRVELKMQDKQKAKFNSILKAKFANWLKKAINQLFKQTIIDIKRISKNQNISQKKNQQFVQYKFINLEKIEMFIRDKPFSQDQKENIQKLKSLSNVISKESIQWDKIVTYIKTNQIKDVNSCKRQNEIAMKLLTKDLQALNINIQAKDFLQWLKSNQHRNQNCQNFKVTKRRSNKIYNSQVQITEAFKRLQYFNGSQLSGCVSKRQASSIDSSMIQLCVFNTQILEPIERFKKDPMFIKYVSDSTKDIMQILNTHQIRSFLLNQLRQKQKIQQLLGQIKAIVDKSDPNQNKKTIQAIYAQVNRQIAVFNNDINQISCQMSLTFEGYCHLYAIYYIWKKSATEIIRNKKAPLEELKKDKQRQLKYFLNETSGNQEMICETQAEKLLDKVIAHIQGVIQNFKDTQIDDSENQFKTQNTRQKIQQKIDTQIFRAQTPCQEILQYLENPRKFIENKYEDQTVRFLKSLEIDFKTSSIANNIYKEISQCFDLLQAQLSINGYQIKRQQAGFNNFFSIVQTRNQIFVDDPAFQENAKRIFFKYIIDLFIQKQEKVYENGSLNAKPDKRRLAFTRVPDKCLQNLVQSLKKTDLGITNLVIFVEKFRIKLLEVKKKILLTTQMNKNDEASFRKKVKTHVCRQKCPACLRICGQQGVNHPQHSCKFGHQIRALGNVKLQNGEASVVRCQDLHPFSMMNYNGQDMSWTGFKHYHETHENVKWKFDDLIPGNRKKIFDQAWNIVGKAFCEKNQMTWVPSNQISAQNQMQSAHIKTHYIFAIDQSGSMGGKPWKDAISAFNETIQNIKKQNCDEANRISVIKFSDRSRIVQQNRKPSQIIVDNHMKGGGTCFSQPFKHAIQIAKKYIDQYVIIFLFMSDGDANYPTKQVQTIKEMQEQRPGKFSFNGLQYNSANQNIKKMARQLRGTTSGPITGRNQLVSRLKEIINREKQNRYINNQSDQQSDNSD